MKANYRFGTQHIAAVIILLGIALGPGCSRREVTATEVAEMFERVGGVEKVSKEARAIFDRFGTNEFRFIYDQDLREFPAIAALGNSVGIYPKASGVPANIRIRFGPHANTKFIFIYDPNESSGVKQQAAAGFIEVTNNIFVSP